MNLRLFCALPVPASVESELSVAVGTLKSSLSSTPISWVKAGNFHLTLSFLGDVEEKQVPELAARLGEACHDTRPFELTCQRLGCFPNVNRPRVLWAGVESQQSELGGLQERVPRACAPFAQREEKSRFHGHITLGRIRPGARVPSGQIAREVERHREVVFGRWSVSEVELISSDLSQGAPRYSVIERFPL